MVFSKYFSISSLLYNSLLLIFRFHQALLTKQNIQLFFKLLHLCDHSCFLQTLQLLQTVGRQAAAGQLHLERLQRRAQVRRLRKLSGQRRQQVFDFIGILVLVLNQNSRLVNNCQKDGDAEGRSQKRFDRVGLSRQQDQVVMGQFEGGS